MTHVQALRDAKRAKDEQAAKLKKEAREIAQEIRQAKLDAKQELVEHITSIHRDGFRIRSQDLKGYCLTGLHKVKGIVDNATVDQYHQDCILLAKTIDRLGINKREIVKQLIEADRMLPAYLKEC